MSSPLSELIENTPIEEPGNSHPPFPQTPRSFPFGTNEDVNGSISPLKVQAEAETSKTTNGADAGTPAKAGGTKSSLTEREEQLLKVAVLHCLKSGPPEIDYEKFMEHGEFKTMKTAQNTWGKIKSKLSTATGATPTKTPAKTPTKTPTKTPKKRSTEVEKADDDGSPKKSAKKTPVKKGRKTVTAGADETPVKEEAEE